MTQSPLMGYLMDHCVLRTMCVCPGICRAKSATPRQVLVYYLCFSVRCAIRDVKMRWYIVTFDQDC